VRGPGRERGHLGAPRIADVASDDLELRELARHVVEVRNRPAGLRGAERPRVADLQAERDAELDAFGVERVVAAIVGRQVPEPRHDAQRAESELANAAAELTDGVERAVKVDRGDTDQAVGISPHAGRDLVVADERPLWSPPRTEKPDADTGVVH